MPSVTVTPTVLTVAEGDSMKYTMVLDAKPVSVPRIRVSLASGSDTDITVNETFLYFRPDNWNVAQEVTVFAAEDDDALNGAATIEHTVTGGLWAGSGYDGVAISSITVTEADNDIVPGVTVTPTALTVAEGDNVKYTVVLDTQPSADVTISLSFASGSDEDITVDNPSLTFTPDTWDAAQEVTISAAEDADATNGTATIEHAVAGADYASVTASDVTVTEADNDPDTGGDPGTGGDPPDTIPNAPQSLRATIGSAQVTLHWDAPGNDGGAAITGYAYRYQESGGDFIAWTDIPGGANVRSYTVTGLMNERAYTFQVHAVNSVGRGASAEVAVTLPEVTSAESEEIPTEVTLQGNYPNPFNPHTTIRYALPKAGEARLAVYDLIGHEVAVLVDEPKPAGNHTVRFDAADLPSGLYVYRLQAGGKIVTRSMMLVK